ncbi:MAG: phosphomannomutase/phosphoglucomutase, partial [Aggregatilineales bacterium]
MTAIHPGIFKKYDIRGKAMGDDAVLTVEAARLIGQGIGTFFTRVKKQNRIVVGRDNRHSSYELQMALMDGLQRASVQVVDIGLVATPLVYWHAVNEGDIGGVMVTGSHLKPPFNGFKLCLGNRPIYDGDIQQIRSYIESGNLAYGQSAGSLTTNQGAYRQYINDIEARVDISQ